MGMALYSNSVARLFLKVRIQSYFDLIIYISYITTCLIGSMKSLMDRGQLFSLLN